MSRRQGSPKPPGDRGPIRPDAVRAAEALSGEIEDEGADRADDGPEVPPRPLDPTVILAEIIATDGQAEPDHISLEGSRCREAYLRLDDIMRIRATTRPDKALVGSLKRSWRRWPRLVLAGAVGAAAGIILGDPVTGFTAATAVALAESALDAKKIRHRRGEKPYPDVPEFQNAWAFMSFLLVRYVNGYNARVSAVNQIRADRASPRLVRLADFMAIELDRVEERLVHARDILAKFQPPAKADVFHETDGFHDRLWAYDPLSLKESDACLGWLETVQDDLFVGQFEEQLIADVNYIHFGHVEVSDMDPWLRLKRMHPELWKQFIEDPESPPKEPPSEDDDGE